ncbi:hypothetical protein GGR57DRAFT_504605 [Xylariaceae sp. FL1272]|nr:hypothetical protein GGR57DRAFT_504605 [Xylariaceae sp. FL1272]
MDEINEQVRVWSAKCDKYCAIVEENERVAMDEHLEAWIRNNRHLCVTINHRFVTWPCLTRGGNARMDLLDGDEFDTRFTWVKRLYDWDLTGYRLVDEIHRVQTKAKETAEIAQTCDPARAVRAKMQKFFKYDPQSSLEEKADCIMTIWCLAHGMNIFDALPAHEDDPSRRVFTTPADCRVKPGPYHKATRSRRVPKPKPDPEEEETDFEDNEEDKPTGDTAEIDRAREVAKDIAGKDWMKRLVFNQQLAEMVVEEKEKASEMKEDEQKEQIKRAKQAKAKALERFESEKRHREVSREALTKDEEEAIRKMIEVQEYVRLETERLMQDTEAKKEQLEKLRHENRRHEKPQQSASDSIPPSAQGVFHGGFPLYAHVHGTDQYIPMEEWLNDDSSPFSAKNLYTPTKKQADEESAEEEPQKAAEVKAEVEVKEKPAEKKAKDEDNTKKMPAEQDIKDEKDEAKSQPAKKQKKHKKKAKARVKF